MSGAGGDAAILGELGVEQTSSVGNVVMFVVFKFVETRVYVEVSKARSPGVGSGAVLDCLLDIAIVVGGLVEGLIETKRLSSDYIPLRQKVAIRSVAYQGSYHFKY